MQIHLTKARVTLERNLIVAVFLLSWLCFELHEFAHYSVVLFQGKTLYAAFNRWWTAEGCGVACSIAGPLTTYALMWIGLLLLLRSEVFHLMGFFLIFASLPLLRVIGPGYLPSGDERTVALELGVHPIWAFLVVLLMVTPPLVLAYRSVSRHRMRTFTLLFLVVPLIFLFLTLLPDYLFLLPAVQRSYESGDVSVLSMGGIPVVIILADILVMSLFFGKYIQYLLLPRTQPPLHEG